MKLWFLKDLLFCPLPPKTPTQNSYPRPLTPQPFDRGPSSGWEATSLGELGAAGVEALVLVKWRYGLGSGMADVEYEFTCAEIEDIDALTLDFQT